jgi:hypothetical protein
MPGAFSSGKNAWGECDVCGQTFRLHALRALTVNGTQTNTLACPPCWNEDHPQYFVNRLDMTDPQALLNPRPVGNLEEQREIDFTPDYYIVLGRNPYP